VQIDASCSLAGFNPHVSSMVQLNNALRAPIGGDMQYFARLTICAAIVTATVLGWDTLEAQSRTRLYLTFASHNDYSASNLPCRPLVQSRERYLANRAALVTLATLIASRGGTYDFQTDWEYMTLVQQWDTAEVTASTGGLNVLAYLARLAPGRVTVHAHSHENNGYNYADVAYMVELLTGQPSTGIVGGYIAAPLTAANWERFRSPMPGARYPHFVWRPVAMWGGGSGMHRNDPTASGVWRPRSHADYYTDDPAQSLVNIGVYSFGAQDVSGVVDLVTRLNQGQLEAGRMYTASLMLEQCSLDSNPSIIPFAAAILDAAQPYLSRGDIVFASLPEVLRIWREEYGSVPTVLRP
jgi:hypothetical protein